MYGIYIEKDFNDKLEFLKKTHLNVDWGKIKSLYQTFIMTISTECIRARNNQIVKLESKLHFNGTYGCYQFKKPRLHPIFLKKALCVQKETNFIC